MSTGGKGSKRRPCFISDEELERRWAAISQASEAAKVEQDKVADEPPEGWPEDLPAWKAQGRGE